MKMVLSWKRVILFSLCSAFTFSSLTVSVLPWSLHLLIQMTCAISLGVYVLMNAEILLMKRYRGVNLLALLYILSCIVSLWMNHMLSVYEVIVLAGSALILPFIEIQREKGHVYFLCRVQLFWLVILLLANDVLMVLMPGSFYGDGISRNFLVGNKFSASYDHIMLLMMVCILCKKEKKHRAWVAVLFAVVVFICHFVDCNTAMIGTAVFMLVFYSPSAVHAFLSRKGTLTIAVILSAAFIFFGGVVQHPAIRSVIEDQLGRDASLTGRDRIYEVLPMIIRARPVFGYGKSADIISRYTGAFNAQNGFFDLAVQNGIPSAILYVLLLRALVRRGAGNAGALLGGIYGFLVMSTVEMTFGTTLILFGILLYTDRKKYEEKTVTILEWRAEKDDPCAAVCQ